MIIGAIVLVLALCLFAKQIDRAAAAQRESDAATGAPTQVLQSAYGCLSLFGWLCLIGLLVALVGALMVGGMGG
jgi:hypothetical protein